MSSHLKYQVRVMAVKIGKPIPMTDPCIVCHMNGSTFTINKKPSHVVASIYHTYGSVMGYDRREFFFDASIFASSLWVLSFMEFLAVDVTHHQRFFCGEFPTVLGLVDFHGKIPSEKMEERFLGEPPFQGSGPKRALHEVQNKTAAQTS